jgi:hypothetical protein
MRFDTSLINFGMSAETPQVIKPELVWTKPEPNFPPGPNGTKYAVSQTNLVADNGIVYFLTFNRIFYDRTKGTVATLAAVNAANKSELWHRDLVHVIGDRTTSLLIHNSKIHVIDMAPSCYRISDGTTVYEKDWKANYEYTDASPFLTGISYYNDKIYYTTGLHSNTAGQSSTADPNRVKNIVCISAATGNLVWGDLVPHGGTISTFPLINRGRAYIVTDRGLRVYMADSGSLIGVDTSVQSGGANHNLMYNDMFIYPDRRGSDRAILTAIRAD